MGWMWGVALTWLAGPGSAWACPGQEDCGVCAHGEQPPSTKVHDPSACAKRSELVGGACSYTTSLVAERVLAEGKAWTFEGHLVASPNALDSRVAAPFVVGPESVHVVANEVLEALVASGSSLTRVILEGHRLEVDGWKYFVITSYRVPAT